MFQATHCSGEKLSGADELSQLHIPQTREIKKTYYIQLWDGTEEMQLQGDNPELCT